MLSLPSQISPTFEAARRTNATVAVHGPEAFEGMRRAGRLAAEVLDLLVPEVTPGVATAKLDTLAYEYILDHGAIAVQQDERRSLAAFEVVNSDILDIEESTGGRMISLGHARAPGIEKG